jgi:myo-inositol-1-phosphate synthase
VSTFRYAIVGLGNCASSLLQGLALFREGGLTANQLGLAGPYADLDPGSLECVCAFDIDARKIDRKIGEAIFSLPNCVPRYGSLEGIGTAKVYVGPVLDGIAPSMIGEPESATFVPTSSEPADVIDILKKHRAEVILSLLPTGAVKATEYYANAALEAGAGFINATATPLATNSSWRERFERKSLVLIGDDTKSQFGATFAHEVLLASLGARGCNVLKTFQINVGGNTDFLNMTHSPRRSLKENSKSAAISFELAHSEGAQATTLIGGYVPYKGDSKIAFIEIEAEGFAARPLRMRLQLEVEDSPNAGGTLVSALLGAARIVELDRLDLMDVVSAQAMKSPPAHFSDLEVRLSALGKRLNR